MYVHSTIKLPWIETSPSGEGTNTLVNQIMTNTTNDVLVEHADTLKNITPAKLEAIISTHGTEIIEIIKKNIAYYAVKVSSEICLEANK